MLARSNLTDGQVLVYLQCDCNSCNQQSNGDNRQYHCNSHMVNKWHGIHCGFTNCFVFWKVCIRVHLTVFNDFDRTSGNIWTSGLIKWSEFQMIRLSDDPWPVWWIFPTSFNSFSKTFSQPDIFISDFIFSTSDSNSGWTVALTITHWEDGKRVLLKISNSACKMVHLAWIRLNLNIE